MSAGRICVREVYLADADESVSAAAKRMQQHNVGSLVVLDQASAPGDHHGPWPGHMRGGGRTPNNDADFRGHVATSGDGAG